jgi:hypothetical protein
MKQFLLVAAAGVLLTTLLPDGAFAQRGGVRGAVVAAGVPGKVGPGVRGRGFRGAGWGGPGPGWRGGWGGPGPVVYGGVGLAVAPGYSGYSGSTVPCIVTEGRKFGFGCP